MINSRMQVKVIALHPPASVSQNSSHTLTEPPLHFCSKATAGKNGWDIPNVLSKPIQLFTYTFPPIRCLTTSDVQAHELSLILPLFLLPLRAFFASFMLLGLVPLPPGHWAPQRQDLFRWHLHSNWITDWIFVELIRECPLSPTVLQGGGGRRVCRRHGDRCKPSGAGARGSALSFSLPPSTSLPTSAPPVPILLALSVPSPCFDFPLAHLTAAMDIFVYVFQCPSCP